MNWFSVLEARNLVCICRKKFPTKNHDKKNTYWNPHNNTLQDSLGEECWFDNEKLGEEFQKANKS